MLQLNSRRLQALDTKNQTPFGAMASDILTLFVFSITDSQNPRSVENLSTAVPGLM